MRSPGVIARPALLAALVGAAASPLADAAYTGLLIREEPSLSTAASQDLGHPTSVLRLVARFDAPGAAGQIGEPGLENNVVVVEADLSLAPPQTSLFQTPPPFGSDAPPSAALLALEPTLAFDSYVSIGVQTVEDGGDANTQFGPDWIDAGFRQTGVTGTYFASAPPLTGNALGAADEDGEVFLAQLTIEGLDLGDQGSLFERFAQAAPAPPPPDIPEDSLYTRSLLRTDLLTGDLRVFTHRQFGGFDVHDIRFIPSPGGFGVALLAAGVAAHRRRR